MGKAECFEYTKLRPGQLKEAIRRIPAAYVPLGAPEWHGPHLPLGLDGLKAEHICRKAWERTGGVLFPTDYWHSIQTMPFPHTFSFSTRHLDAFVRSLSGTLEDMGFRVIVILSGHYPAGLVHTLRKRTRRHNRRGKSILIGIHEPLLALDRGYLGDHAAMWETSIMLAVDRALVDMGALDYSGISSYERVSRYGIMGRDPKTEASAAAGRKIIAHIVKRLADMVKANLEKPDPQGVEDLYAHYDRFFRRPVRLGIKELDCRGFGELLKIAWWQFRKTGRLF